MYTISIHAETAEELQHQIRDLYALVERPKPLTVRDYKAQAKVEASSVVPAASKPAPHPTPRLFTPDERILNWRAQGWSIGKIAEELRRLDLRTAHGNAWYSAQVRERLTDLGAYESRRGKHLNGRQA